MAGNPINYGQTFVWNGKIFVQVMNKRHCGDVIFGSTVLVRQMTMFQLVLKHLLRLLKLKSRKEAENELRFSWFP